MAGFADSPEARFPAEADRTSWFAVVARRRVPVTERLEGMGAAFWMRSCTFGLHLSYSAAPNSEIRRSLMAW